MAKKRKKSEDYVSPEQMVESNFPVLDLDGKEDDYAWMISRGFVPVDDSLDEWTHDESFETGRPEPDDSIDVETDVKLTSKGRWKASQTIYDEDGVTTLKGDPSGTPREALVSMYRKNEEKENGKG